METYIYVSELYHHGILGQKWGKRNGPPYPLEPEDHSASEQKAGWKKSLSNASSSVRSVGAKIKTKAENNLKKTTIGRKYDSLSERDKKKVRKIATGIAIGAGIGVAAYVIYKKGFAPTDKDIRIPAGEVFQRISPTSETGLHDTFYASFGKHDNRRYEKMLPVHYNFSQGADEVFKKNFSFSSDIKIAGNSTCEKIFRDLYENDADFADNLPLGIDFKKIFGPAGDIIGNGQKGMYERFNQHAVERNVYKTAYDKFFDRLKQLGYDGFVDINDQKKSGYRAKAPVVMFNNNITNLNMTKMTFSDNSIKRYRKELLKLNIAEIQSKFSSNPATILAIAGLGGIAGYKYDDVLAELYGLSQYSKARLRSMGFAIK